jgi:hypothetical protein
MSVASETESPIHFISHIHDGDTVYAKYECRASKEAACHRYPDCECEVPCDHPKIQQDECWTESWMNESCDRECFVGPRGTPVHDGAVHVSFNGDCVEWEYL